MVRILGPLVEVCAASRVGIGRSVVVVSGAVVGLHRRRCSFISRLAWEASRSLVAMDLLTWWRSRSQLATSPIEPSSTLFWSSLSCCHLSSFSLPLLPLKVSTSAPHLVLYFINFSFFYIPNLWSNSFTYWFRQDLCHRSWCGFGCFVRPMLWLYVVLILAEQYDRLVH